MIDNIERIKGKRAWGLFKKWAQGVDERRLWWIAGGVIVAALLLQWKSQAWTLRAVLAATAVSIGLYKGASDPIATMFVKTWFSSVVFLSVFHFARIWLGSGWWAVLFLVLVALGYRVYKMRGLLRLWWLWYKDRVVRAWRGER